MVPISQHVIPCCIDVPPSFQPKATYALETLLRPLGLEPDWVRTDELGLHGIYYGKTPPTSGTTFHLDDQTIAYFEQQAAYNPELVRWEEWGGERWPCLFRQVDGTTPDLIASAFFWLSGWQECTVKTRDQHGRFPYSASLQAALGTALIPYVDVYREQLSTVLKQAGITFQQRTWRGRSWAFCPTHDIDYLKKWRKGMIWREVIHYFLLNRRRTTGAQRLQRLARFLKAWVLPGDVYRASFVRMVQEVEESGGTATYFLKTGATSPHDVLYPIHHPFLLQKMPRMEEAGFEMGLHPSYYGHTRWDSMREEKQRLDEVLKSRSVSVRQHYLRYDHSLTSEVHIANGFRIDSTLGFAEHEGFRHATCQPFQLFDIKANHVLDIWEMPLAIMDGALFNRRNLSLDQAIEHTQALLRTCQRYGGVCVALWHNTLWDELDFPGWGAHFENTLVQATEQQALISSLKSALTGWGSD